MENLTRKRKIIYMLSFMIPAIMYIITLIFTHTFPFGDNSLIISDIDNQFISFYTYFKHIINNNDSLTYTFSKTLGGDMVGFSGYYLQNPFLFIILLFSYDYIPVGIVLIIGIQLALMGLTMSILLSNIVSDEKLSIPAVIMCSSAYAFIGYNLSYISLPIYFSSLIVIPLVILGIHKIIENYNSKLYIITLFIVIIFNYYIGYMICIFSLLYFIYYIYINNKIKQLKYYIKFISSSILAVGLSAFNLIPIIFSLRNQKLPLDTKEYIPSLNYSIKALIRNMFIGAFHGDLSNSSAPYIYVGEVILIFVCIFVISNKIKLQNKISICILLFILIISTYISTFDNVWHGFNKPVGFAHRYSFIISIVLIIAGYYGVMLLQKRRLIWIFTLVEIMLLTVNAIISLNNYENISLSNYQLYYNSMSECIQTIQNNDDSFYRIEKDFERNHNDSMLLNYNGITHNSSCDDASIKEFVSKLGIRYYSPIWTFYNQGSTTFTDCLLGVKYLISRFDSTNKPYSFELKCNGYNKSGEEQTSYVYKNPYALPLCFGVENKDIDMDNENLFQIQNDIAGVDIYTEAIEPISNVDTNDTISFDIKVRDDCNLYFYATAPDYQGAELLINDWSYEDYFSVSRWNIVNIGHFLKDEIVNIKLHATNGNIHVNKIYVYAEDMNKLLEWYNKASVDLGNITKITSSHLIGNINITKTNKIVFTIPYEKAWKIKLNGKYVNTSKSLGALLSVDVKPGNYYIEMTYVPEGLIVGIIISLLSILVIILNCMKHNKYNVRKGEKR